MVTVRGCRFPTDRYYQVEFNVWLKPGEQGVVTLGATTFGVALAGEFIAFVPKPVATRIGAGRAVGLLEIAKTLTSVRSPADAVVVGSNAAAVADPLLINSDPYGEGWLMQLRFDDWPAVAGSLASGAAIAPAFEAAMALDNFSAESRA
jgi:glycine cleavage system H protein